MIHRQHVLSFRRFEVITERICAADLDIRDAKFHLISAYMPDTRYDDASVEIAYNQLDTLCDKATQAGRRIVAGGDFNTVVGSGQVGEEHILGPHGSGTRNARGEGLMNWAEMQDLSFTHSFFNRPVGNRWSYSHGEDRSLIDYILVD